MDRGKSGMSPFIEARRLPEVSPPVVRDAPEALQPYLEDASGARGGHASGLVRVASEAEAAAFLRETAGQGVKILPQAARSSLTGGAVPRGEVIVSVEALRDTGSLQRTSRGARATFGAGLRLRELQEYVAEEGYYYPPVPTHQEAMIGGSASTNAGGAATFKYGVTREWIHGLRVLLFNGDLLAIERGQAVARRGESFRIRLSDGGELTVPVPDYRLPDLKKISAGYFAADPLDLIDLFVGSEGTLGLITAVTVDLVPQPPSVVTGLVFLSDEDAAFELATDLRLTAQAARDRGDPAGPDVRAIEWMDPHCLDILRRYDEARKRRIRLPDTARAGVLFETELAEPMDNERAQDRLVAALDGGSGERDDGLIRLFRLLRDQDVLDELEFAFPEDDRRHKALVELREAVPQRVGELAARTPGVGKLGGDFIVPFERLHEMMRIYADGFERRGLAYAVWGHLGDGNLHPNPLLRTEEEGPLAVEAMLEFADEAVRRGGCPLSEHGVGRSPLKQRLLRRFLGNDAVEQMRRIKRALDPPGRFAPGTLFPEG
jgi:D-lactate dehydrogenase (cytochrome)